MNCVDCGHDGQRHDANGCRVVFVGKWDPVRGAFSRETPCGCKQLVRPPVKIPPSPNGCGHEFADAIPHCVHCGMSVEEKAGS